MVDDIERAVGKIAHILLRFTKEEHRVILDRVDAYFTTQPIEHPSHVLQPRGIPDDREEREAGQEVRLAGVPG